MDDELLKKRYYKEWEEIFDSCIFHERNRKIIKRKLLDGITYDALEDEFKMSSRQIKNIVKKGKNTLLNNLH